MSTGKTMNDRWPVPIIPTRVILLSFAAALLHAQLDTERHISGVVIDTAGNPIANAAVDHSTDGYLRILTDSEGKFDLLTQAPRIVIRKAGYRSEALPTQGALDLRVTLRDLGERRVFPLCSATGQYAGLGLQFRKTPEVVSGPINMFSDYIEQNYTVRRSKGKKGIRHGSGGTWGPGLPWSDYVWRSAEYEEVAYASPVRELSIDGMIVDARGKLPDGTRWRHIGRFGETAAYSGVDESTAAILDKYLDGACLKAPSNQ